MVMNFFTLNPIVLLICILATKIECAQDCSSGQYYSAHIPGCTPCPGNCSDQDARDVDRCRKACETKNTGAPEFPTTNEVSKSDETTPQPAVLANTIFETSRSPNKTTFLSPKPRHSTESTHVGLAVSLGVLGTIAVCLVALVAYIMWRWNSNASYERPNDAEAQVVEKGGEPSTSSQEPSPVVTKRSEGCQANRRLEIDGISLPIPETKELLNPEEIDYVSSLNLDEYEN